MTSGGPGRGSATIPEANSSKIQFLLGHVSVEIAETYIGCRQRLRVAVNDKLGIEPG